MDNQPDIHAIERFLANTCDYAEAECIANHLLKSDEVLDSITIFDEADGPQAPQLDDHTKEKIYYHIIGKKPQARVLSFKKLLVAASIIGLLVLSWFLIVKDNNTPPVTTAVTGSYFKNKTGADVKYHLPDGSEIVLLPNAEIFYNADFIQHRKLTLMSGDVFLVVARDEKHPFSVSANGINTTAVGTQFWVRNFKKSGLLSIALTEGRVVISSEDEAFTMEPLYIKPGQTCYIDKNKGMVEVKGGNKAATPPAPAPIKRSKAPIATIKVNDVVWTNQDIRFANTTLKNVFSKIEQRYHVSIIVDDTVLPNSYLTGKILHNDSLETIMKALCDINQLTYKISGDTIYITKP